MLVLSVALFCGVHRLHVIHGSDADPNEPVAKDVVSSDDALAESDGLALQTQVATGGAAEWKSVKTTEFWREFARISILGHASFAICEAQCMMAFRDFGKKPLLCLVGMATLPERPAWCHLVLLVLEASLRCHHGLLVAQGFLKAPQDSRRVRFDDKLQDLWAAKRIEKHLGPLPSLSVGLCFAMLKATNEEQVGSCRITTSTD